MSRNVIAGGAAQRAIAGLMSLALVSGGLVVPSVANAAEETGKAVCRSGMVAPSFGKKSSKEVTLDRDIYKAGDVVEVKITGLDDLTAKQNLRLTLDGALWPEDQSKGDGLELLDDAVALKIPTSKIENGEVTVRVVLPSVFEEGFKPGENAIAVQLNDNERPVEVKGVVFRANESGKAAGACGPENPNGDKPEPEDAPASGDQSGKDQDTNSGDDNQGNTEQPGNENQDDKSVDQGDKDQGGKDQPGNNEQAGVEKPAGQDGKPADQDNKDQGTKPADQGGKDQDGKGKDQGGAPADQAGKDQGSKPADQASKDQPGKDQNKPSGQDGKTQPGKDQTGKDQNTKDQGTKPADQGGKDQGAKPSGQNKPADQAGKDQSGKPADQAGKDQPGKDQDGRNQGSQDPKDPKITPSTQFSQLSSVRGIVGSIFAVLGLTALFAGALGIMAKYNVIPANWIPQQLRHLSR